MTNVPARVEGDRHAMKQLARLRLLIIEDDPDARELMQAVLEQRGATVTVADSVAAAEEALTSLQPDVIVSDIAMPEEDGIGFIRRFRTRSAADGGRTPAIAVSAFVGHSDRARAVAAGFDRYLFKPVDFDALCSTILAVLDSNKASA